MTTYTKTIHKIQKIYNDAFELRDGASIAALRIILGLLLLKDVAGQFQYYHNYIPDAFRASYYGFEWLQAHPALITICMNILPFSTFCIILGLFYRIAMPLTALCVSYLYLISPEHYLNHYYMLILFLILLSIIPANNTWSLDNLIKKEKNTSENKIPAWCYWILKLQTEIILIYAGLVKINNDWLSLQPLSEWIRTPTHQSDYLFIRAIFQYDLIIAIGAYGIILLHIIGAPLLYYKKTRIWIFIIYCCFHFANSFLFNIGVFPYMAIGVTTLFFAPDWPRKYVLKLSPIYNQLRVILKTLQNARIPRNVTIAFLCMWLAFQILNPLPVLFSSNLKTAWHDHHERFTWRMMLNNEVAYTVSFIAYMPEKQIVEFIPLGANLTQPQCVSITTKPNMTVQFAQYLQDKYKKKYQTQTVEIRAYIMLSINFREPELWADPTVNIANYKTIYGIQEWVQPVNNPLRSWKEYMDAPKYIQPTYADVLMATNLSDKNQIIYDTKKASLNDKISPPGCL